LRGEELVLVDVDLGELHALCRVIGGDLLEHRRQLLARAAPLRPEVEDNQRAHRPLDDVAFEALDRFAFGFGKAERRHGRYAPLEMLFGRPYGRLRHGPQAWTCGPLRRRTWPC